MAPTTLTDAPVRPSSPTVAAAPPARRNPLAAGGEASVRCRRCGEPIVIAGAPVISSHRWSQGRVTYLRCTCGGVGLAVTTTSFARSA